MVSCLAVLLLLILWQLLATAGSGLSLLPTPVAVGNAIVDILHEAESFDHISATAFRVITAFFIAFSAALILGVSAGYNWVIFQALNPIIIVGLTIPAICWTAIAVMVFGISDWTAIFSGAVIVTPVITSSIVAQMKSLDVELVVMARVYGMRPLGILYHVVLPQLYPALLSGARYGLALCWKVVIIAELLGLSTGVGYQIAYWYNLFSLIKVFAWTMIFVTIMLAVEYFLIAPVEAHVLKWRKDA